ncbi:MAG: phosphoribosylanthranilate isomerase [Eubacteriales bacterium]
MKIKICGLFRPQDAEYVNAALPDYAGFVFAPKSRRYVTDSQATALRNNIRSEIITVGVFVNEPLVNIQSLYRDGVIKIIQLHGDEDEGYISRLRQALPDAQLWKAFIIRSGADYEAAVSCTADKILLDGGSGDGKGFDRTLLPSRLGERFILAGGLTPETIPEAAIYSPYAVDLSSGTESGGVKDGIKIKRAVETARGI